MSRLLVTAYGDPRESLSLERAPGPPLGTNDVLVEMEAAPVNPSDFLLVQGHYGLRPQLPSPVGGEGVGRVIDAGGDAGTQLVGRRVVILPTYEQGTWADKVATSYRNVVAIREDGDPLQLAMLPIKSRQLLQTYHTLNDLVATGELTVPVDATYRRDEYHEAIEHAMTPGRSGKILFTFA